MSSDATLTSKGQTTIPKEIRDSLSMKAGDRMTFTLMPDATVVMRVKTKSITELAGRVTQEGAQARLRLSSCRVDAGGQYRCLRSFLVRMTKHNLRRQES